MTSSCSLCSSKGKLVLHGEDQIGVRLSESRVTRRWHTALLTMRQRIQSAEYTIIWFDAHESILMPFRVLFDNITLSKLISVMQTT